MKNHEGKLVLSDNELMGVTGGIQPAYATVDEVTEGGSVFASDSKGHYRWGTVKKIVDDEMIEVAFGGGCVFEEVNGTLTAIPVSPEDIEVKKFWLTGW